MSERDDRPWFESRGVRVIDDRWVITNAIWHNSHGSNEPETGLRDITDIGEDGKPKFHLLQHYGCFDFQLVNRTIEKAIRKGWSCERIAWFQMRLTDRKSR